MSAVVNFANILLVTFLYKSFACCLFVLTLVLFWCNNIGAKAGLKMLVKLTPNIPYTTVLYNSSIPCLIRPISNGMTI